MHSFCISHKEDVDGICSAALIKAGFDISKVILVITQPHFKAGEGGDNV